MTAIHIRFATYNLQYSFEISRWHWSNSQTHYWRQSISNWLISCLLNMQNCVWTCFQLMFFMEAISSFMVMRRVDKKEFSEKNFSIKISRKFEHFPLQIIVSNKWNKAFVEEKFHRKFKSSHTLPLLQGAKDVSSLLAERVDHAVVLAGNLALKFYHVESRIDLHGITVYCPFPLTVFSQRSITELILPYSRIPQSNLSTKCIKKILYITTNYKPPSIPQAQTLI